MARYEPKSVIRGYTKDSVCASIQKHRRKTINNKCNETNKKLIIAITNCINKKNHFGSFVFFLDLLKY